VPIAIFLFMLLAITVLSAIQSGLLLWGATRLVRLQGFTLRRAIVWTLIMALAGTLEHVVALSVSDGTGLAIDGLFWLAALVTTVVLIKRATACRKRRAIGAMVIWLVLLAPLTFGQGLAIKLTLFDAFTQRAEAMEPTLRDADHFIVDRTLAPRRWDLIVFRPPHAASTLFVSRLVGLPGETVEIIAGRVHIDGTAIPLPAGVPDIAYTSDFANWPSVVGVEGAPITLGDDESFVLGDNTSNSYDSRLWEASKARQAGALPEANIVGVVRIVYSPLSRARLFR
jgi:signal peptidase I